MQRFLEDHTALPPTNLAKGKQKAGKGQQGDRATPPPVHSLALPGQDNWDSLATRDLMATMPAVTAQESFGCTKQV